MAAVCRGLSSLSTKERVLLYGGGHVGLILSGATLSPGLWFVPTRSKYYKARLPRELFAERSQEHEKFGGDPEQPHKLHIVTRVKSVIRRPHWEKKMVKSLGLEKGNKPVIHKNIASVNDQLKFVKHLVRIQPLKTPYGLPSEEDMADSYINSKGELIVRRLLKPVLPEATDA